MKYTIFTSFINSYYNPQNFALLYDNMNVLADQGHEVTYTYCDGKEISKCVGNMTGNKSICKLCNQYRKVLKSHLNKNIQSIPISQYKDCIKNYHFPSYHSMQEIKQIEYENVKIGYAAISTYLTLSRNLYPAFNDDFIKFMDQYLIFGQQYTDIIQQVIRDTKPNVIGCFNARHIYTRPIVDTAINMGIKHISYEVTFNSKNAIVKTSFNTTPHNVTENTNIIISKWNSQVLPIETKKEIASQFFYRRKHSIPAGDKLYVKDQIIGLLPNNFDTKKHNILILNSSEDEFASLGEEFQQNSFFQSQMEGITYLINTFKEYSDYHFYLRVHPNLKTVRYKYHTKLYELFNNIDNFTIINASSPISTYALIDACDKVIVFGSTTGPEAVYWGKPTILLSYCIYSLLNICYIPQNKEELSTFILDKRLSPKDKLGALQYAYYRMNDEYENFKKYEFRIKRVNFFNKHFDLLIFNNYKIMSIKCALIQIIGKILYYKHLYYPQKEETD